MNDTLKYYDNMARQFVSGTRDVQFTEIQDMFLEYIPQRGKILDFGCGSGRDTKYFFDMGYNVEAIDGSEELCKIASEYTGITVKQMLFEELDTQEAYDGIWACASILHVKRQELPLILKKMADATKREGILYVSFKYGNFEGVKNGRYFTYLTEESMQELLTGISELIVEKEWISSDVRANRGDEQWLNLILRKQTLN